MERVFQRIEGAVKQLSVSRDWRDDEVEIVTYPIALMLISALRDDRVKRRYALAEAKRAYELLKNEPLEKLLHIAANTFGWRAKILNEKVGESFYELVLHFSDYIRNAVKIRGVEWKLPNRIVSKGYVYLTKSEFARLLEEEVQRRVLEKIDREPPALQPELAALVEKIRSKLSSTISDLSLSEVPRAVVASAMPPCMKHLLHMLQSGKHIPHMGRFAMASFLLNVGVSEEELIKMLHALTDFNPRMTRYQVEHIAGKRGSRRKYIAPNCKTMQTHGVCFNPDDVCATISHPLSYYRRKIRALFAKKRVGGGVTNASPD